MDSNSDPLAPFRERFFHSGENLIYLDGNSLGRLPLQSRELIADTVDRQWGERLIRSWNEEWIGLSERIGAKIARLVGAQPDEVILTDSTSLNLFKLATAVLRSLPDRRTMVTDDLNFPSDLYILQGLADLFGNRHEIRLARSHDGISVSEESLKKLILHDTALVTLTHVCFKSSFMYDMKRITSMAHEAGALMLWDLSHAAGAVPIDLNNSGADLAVGCTYKYLNGGPGSIAFLYVRKDLQNKLINPVWAWFADANPFEFRLDFTPAAGIRSFQGSTLPVLSAKPVELGVDMLLEAGMEAIRNKSLGLSRLFLELFDRDLEPRGFTLGSPRDESCRGSHLSIRHPEGYRICQALIHPRGDAPVIIPDFRLPDNVRIGFAPLYNTYEEVIRTVERIVEIIDQRIYLEYSSERDAVT